MDERSRNEAKSQNIRTPPDRVPAVKMAVEPRGPGEKFSTSLPREIRRTIVGKKEVIYALLPLFCIGLTEALQRLLEYVQDEG